MKNGICLLLIASQEDPLGKEWIPFIAQCGFDYAEVSLARIYDLPDREIEAYRILFEQSRLPVLAFNNAVPAGFSIIGDEVTSGDQEKYIERAVALASKFGVQTITTSGPNQKRLSEGFDWETCGWKRYVDFMTRFADRCKDHGITLALEPICSGEKGLINRTSQAMEIIKAVNRSNMKLIVDHLHPDCIISHDDWGSRTSLFFSLDTWRDLFKEPYRKLSGKVRITKIRPAR